MRTGYLPDGTSCMNGSASSRDTSGSQATILPEGNRTSPMSITVTGVPETRACVKYESRSMPHERESLASKYLSSHVSSGSSEPQLPSAGDHSSSSSTWNVLPLGRT